MRRGFCLADLVVGTCLQAHVVCSGLPVRFESGCPAAVWCVCVCVSFILLAGQGHDVHGREGLGQ